jgi:hypothetical protein
LWRPRGILSTTWNGTVRGSCGPKRGSASICRCSTSLSEVGCRQTTDCVELLWKQGATGLRGTYIVCAVHRILSAWSNPRLWDGRGM